MKTSLAWIRKYVPDLDADPKAYCDAMTMTGTKAEGYERLDENLDKLVVGRVLTCVDHPDSDHLHVCTVDAGEGEPLQIVCGAPNVREGILVPVVLAGGKVCGSHSEGIKEGGMKIKAGKVRGIESFGMICSVEELGQSADAYPGSDPDGIYVFPEGTEAGSDAVEALGLRDTVVEYEITSNRVDCYSVIGIAREAAMTFGKKFCPPEITATGNDEKTEDYISVEVLDEKLCPRYIARVVKNVKIGPSPKWMQDLLRANGIRPINNVVDITNFVMEEYGQPMHAYDYATVKGKKIRVLTANDGETFTTLDGQERKLDRNVLMIADGERYVGIAGIMGGEDSMITDDCDTVLFEAACFDGTNIRLSAKRIGLQTDASAKFDKGLDPNNARDAIDRACMLMEMCGAGEVVGGSVDVYPSPVKSIRIGYDRDKINALLGTSFSEKEMIDIFTNEGLTYIPETKEVEIPTFRQDLKALCDLAEEVARFTGYDKIPMTLPKGAATAGGLTFADRVMAVCRDMAENCGFSEGYCYSFESPRVFDKLMYPADAKEREAIGIRNPLGPEYSIMRTTSLNGMLTSLALNYNRRNKDVRLYEAGNIYLPKSLPLTELPDEVMTFTMGAYGDVDFFSMKGFAERLLCKLGIRKRLTYKAEELPSYYHPGRAAVIWLDGVRIGEIGEIHPTVADNYGLGERTYTVVLTMPAILPFVTFDHKYTGIARFPAVTRDISCVVPHGVTAGQIEDIILQRGGKILESCRLFDVYEGASLGEGKRSMAYSLSFRHKEKTLTDDEVGAAMKKILNGLATLDIELRGV